VNVAASRAQLASDNEHSKVNTTTKGSSERPASRPPARARQTSQTGRKITLGLRPGTRKLLAKKSYCCLLVEEREREGGGGLGLQNRFRGGFENSIVSATSVPNGICSSELAGVCVRVINANDIDSCVIDGSISQVLVSRKHSFISKLFAILMDVRRRRSHFRAVQKVHTICCSHR